MASLGAYEGKFANGEAKNETEKEKESCDTRVVKL